MRWRNGIKRRIRCKACDAAGSTTGESGDTAVRKSRRIPYNPCNMYFRSIMEQVLAKYQTEYKQLRLVIMDTENENGMDRIHTAEEEYLVRQMVEGLNHFCICTDRPEYFAELEEELLQEYGLLTEFRTKSDGAYEYGSLVLDFERTGYAEQKIRSSQIIYIPIYKEKWEQLENLDIAVPIGYNTVIVKGSKIEILETSPDRLEREFYAE